MDATAELELAPIEAEPKTDLQPLDLRKIDLTDVALAQYGDWRKDVAATKANLATLVLDLSTPTKIKEARTLRQRLIGDPLATVRKVAAGIKSKMAATSKAVGAELEQIEAAYTEADALILPKIEAREAELEAERVEKARIERERVENLQAGVAKLRGYAERAIGQPSEKIAQAVAALIAMEFPADRWQECAAQAVLARDQTVEKLRTLQMQALEAERLREENARLQAAAAEAAARVQAAADAGAIGQQQAQRVADIVAQAVAQVQPPAPAPAPEPSPEPSPMLGDTPAPATIRYVRSSVFSPAPAPAPIVEALQPSAPAAPVERQTMNLGALSARLGFTVTAGFLGGLGVEPCDTNGRALLYDVAEWPAIKAALVKHIEGLA